MECAICLNDIPVHEEAFLLPSCYHAFHFTCITTWTQQQLRHPPMRQGSDGSFQPCASIQCLCPLCKRPYTTIVYECIDGTFKVHRVEGAAQGADTLSVLPQLLHLSAQQQRRRSLYMRLQEQDAGGQAQAQQQQQEQQGQGQQEHRQRPQQQLPQLLHVRRAQHKPDSRAVEAFVRRDLQALLLRDDVELVLQHTLGTLQALLTTPGVGTATGSGRANSGSIKRQRTGNDAGASSSSSGSCSSAWVAALGNTLQPFLQQHSHSFARELARFLGAGLTLAAYDEVQQTHTPQQQQRQAQPGAVDVVGPPTDVAAPIMAGESIRNLRTTPGSTPTNPDEQRVAETQHRSVVEADSIIVLDASDSDSLEAGHEQTNAECGEHSFGLLGGYE